MSHKPAKYLTMEEVAYLAYAAFEKQPGNREDNAAVATAIAWAESKGNYNAHNDNYKRGGRDDSYGLWQINMLGAMGDRRRQFFGIKSNDDLFDVNENATAMVQLYVNKGHSFRDWTTYNTGVYRLHLAKAKLAVGKRKAPGHNEGREERAEAVENDWLAKILGFPGSILDWINSAFMRVAGFIGGGVLLILAIVLYVRWQQK